MLSVAVWSTLGACLAATAAASAPAFNFIFDPETYHPDDVIYRDVAVVGGGSSGTYTAVRLKDHNKTVVVIEKKDTLGGHAETYTAPDGSAIDFAVLVFNQVKVVKDYFARFSIPWIVSKLAAPIDFVDFDTGKSTNFSLPPAQTLAAAFGKYLGELAKYPELKTGFNLTYPVAEDLLLSFRDFADKYDLGPMVYTAFMHQGLVPLLDAPMLYVFKYIDAHLIESQASGYLMPRDHDVQALYRAARAFLGNDNVLTGSRPVVMDRGAADRVKIVVATPRGQKLIVAKKLVSAIPPTLQSLRAYDLSADERSLFSKWIPSGYYAGILKNTSLNASVNYFFAQPEGPYGVPRLPGPFEYGTTRAAGLTLVLYGSPTVLSDDQVKDDVETRLARVQEEHGLPQTAPDWAVFSSHSPFNIQVSRQDIKDGFYKKLAALNGKRNTFYNGGAFQTWSSTALWEYTEDFLLPLILEALP